LQNVGKNTFLIANTQASLMVSNFLFNPKLKTERFHQES